MSTDDNQRHNSYNEDIVDKVSTTDHESTVGRSLGDIEKQDPEHSPDNEPVDVPDAHLVSWNGPGDPENPFVWAFRKKLRVSAVMCSMPLVVNIGSSIMSATSASIRKEFNIGVEVSILPLTLFLMGFTLGPPIFGPLSEKMGRRIPILTGVILFSTFCIPIAVAQNVQTIMISRFFSGAFGSSTMAITGGALADIWGTPLSRGVALDCFVATAFIGPVLGPIMGSFIAQSYLGWRWCLWITMILGYSASVAGVLFLPETFGPKLLTERAKRLRVETKDWALHSKAEEERTDLASLVRVYLLRPWLLLVTEPILILVTLYISFLYGLLFLFFEAYPISFQQDRGWKPGLASLPFLGLLVGALVGVGLTVGTAFWKEFKKDPNGPPKPYVPETRLPLMIFGAVLLPPGLLWFGWTSHKGTPWPAQVVAGVPVGAAMFIVFIQGFKYIVDVYLRVANSAISANTFVRSLFGAGFPLFSIALYHTLGVDWASTLLAVVSVVLAPMPLAFYIWGARIRSWSKASL